MIPDFKTYLKESIWSDMQERGTGDIDKKEDDIELLDRDGFFSYLESHYEYISDQDPRFYGLMKSSRDHSSISVPIYQYGVMLYAIYLEFDGHEGRFDMRGFDRIIKYLNIKPDEGQPTNEFFLEVIDFMIENIEEPLKKTFVKK